MIYTISRILFRNRKKKKQTSFAWPIRRLKLGRIIFKEKSDQLQRQNTLIFIDQLNSILFLMERAKKRKRVKMLQRFKLLHSNQNVLLNKKIIRKAPNLQLTAFKTQTNFQGSRRSILHRIEHIPKIQKQLLRVFLNYFASVSCVNNPYFNATLAHIKKAVSP